MGQALQDLSAAHYLDELSNRWRERHQITTEQVDFAKYPQGATDEKILAEKIRLVKTILDKANDSSPQTVNFFAPFVDKFWELKKLYSSILLNRKREMLAGKGHNDPKILALIADKMILAAIFSVAIYREKHVFIAALKKLEQLLYEFSDGKFDAKSSVYQLDQSLSQLHAKAPNSMPGFIRENHNHLNLLRLFLLRLWRAFNVHLTMLLATCKEYMDGFSEARESGLGAFFNYIWVFFVPRLLVNFCTLFYAVFGGLAIFGKYRLPDLERELGVWQRLKLRLNDIGFEIANDLMWFVSGIVLCFSLVHGVPLIGIYVMIAAQAYDFFVILFRNYLDGQRQNGLQKDLSALAKDKGLNANPLLNDLNTRIEFDKMVLFYAVLNFALLIMCITFLTPTFANLTPILPIIAGVITALAAPLRGYYIQKCRNKSREIDPELIKADTIAVVTVSDDDFDINKCESYLGIYNRGFVVVLDSKNSAKNIYAVDKKYENSWKELTSVDTLDLPNIVTALIPRAIPEKLGLTELYAKSNSSFDDFFADTLRKDSIEYTLKRTFTQPTFSS